MATKTLIDGKNNHQTQKPTSASMGLSDFQSHVLREFTSLSETVHWDNFQFQIHS